LFAGTEPVIPSNDDDDKKPKNVKWTDADMSYTSVLSKQSWLYNQFRYLCEMREIIQKEYNQYDGGIEGVFWIGGLAINNRKLGGAAQVGNLSDSTRFERCLKALELPTVPAMPFC
jgi:hypothetical protein